MLPVARYGNTNIALGVGMGSNIDVRRTPKWVPSVMTRIHDQVYGIDDGEGSVNIVDASAVFHGQGEDSRLCFVWAPYSLGQETRSCGM